VQNYYKYLLSSKHALKITPNVGRVAQEVEHLPSKCETLNSNPSTIKKKKKERKFPLYYKSNELFDEPESK
jgi:hypothetical protein